MTVRSYVTKTVVYSDLFDDKEKTTEEYLIGINKLWLIQSVVYMISVDRFDSFSMSAGNCLLVMFQDYQAIPAIKQLFIKLRQREQEYPGAWLTIINHRALFRLLIKVLMCPNEMNGKDESYEAYWGLLKAVLVENNREMQREKKILGKIGGPDDEKDAKIIMQQDMLSLDQFGENKKELEKGQILKCLALCNYGRKHPEVGNAIKRVIAQHGYESEYKYLLLAQMPLSIYQDKDGFGEGLITINRDEFLRRGNTMMWDGFVSYVKDKSIDVWDLEKMSNIFSEKELLDNTCFRKYPVLKMSPDEYLIVSQNYYAHLFYDSFWWSVKEEMRKDMSDAYVMTILTKVFSEDVLFYNAVIQMVGDTRIAVYNEHCFKDGQAKPDVAIRTRKNLFIFEYKDMRIKREVADGSDIGALMAFLDDRLNKGKERKGKNKGLPQLVACMEDFFSGKAPWDSIGSVTVQPILVVNSRLFGVRGINYLLEKKMRERLMSREILKNHLKEIGELLVMDYDMLIMLSSWSYKDFSRFQQLTTGFHTLVQKASQPFEKYLSFRHYVMNKWSDEMTKSDKKQFQHGYERLVKKIVN